MTYGASPVTTDAALYAAFPHKKYIKLYWDNIHPAGNTIFYQNII